MLYRKIELGEGGVTKKFQWWQVAPNERKVSQRLCRLLQSEKRDTQLIHRALTKKNYINKKNLKNVNYSQRIKRLLKFDHKIAFDSHKQKLHYLNSVKRCMYSSKQYKIYQPKKIFKKIFPFPNI